MLKVLAAAAAILGATVSVAHAVTLDDQHNACGAHLVYDVPPVDPTNPMHTKPVTGGTPHHYETGFEACTAIEESFKAKKSSAETEKAKSDLSIITATPTQ